MVREALEGVAPLRVPLVADIAIAANLADAKR